MRRVKVVFRWMMKGAKPDWSFNSINCVDEKFLIDNMIDVIVVDKDNTLTLPLEETMVENCELFVRKWQTQLGFEKVVMVSNSIGSEDNKVDDYCKDNGKTYKIGLVKHHNFNIMMLNHGSKKPLVKLPFGNVRVLVIGDRLFTDVYLAKEHNYLSVLLPPLTTKEGWLIKLIRGVEWFALYKRQ